MYALAFFVFIEATPRQAIYRGMLIGLSAACINFFWITASAKRFTGDGFVYGIIATAGMALFFALYCGFIGWLYTVIRWKKPDIVAMIANALMIAFVWVLLDAFMIFVAKNFALALFVSYVSVGDNIYALQPAAVLGPLVITFLIVFVNALLAISIYYRKWKLVPVPFVLIGAYLIWGFILLDSYESKLSQNKEKSFKAAIIAENLDPQFKWDKENGNTLAEGMFRLNGWVAKSGADVAIWSESAIPWNYSPGDINEIQSWHKALGRAGKQFPYINSMKSMIGHCLSASGSIESVAAVLQLHHGFIHPSLNATKLHPEIAKLIDKSRVPKETIHQALNIVVKISLGFGDVNSCIVLKKWDA